MIKNCLSSFGPKLHMLSYMSNRVPIQALQNNTLKEVFTSVKHEIGHLCIFVCPVYFHVPKDKGKKLEVIGRKGAFVGYCENSKAFTIYILGQSKVEISRYVTFDEDIALGKARDLPPPPASEKNDDMDILDGPFVLESETDIVDDPMEPMNPLDPTQSYPPTRKRPLWLHDTL